MVYLDGQGGRILTGTTVRFTTLSAKFSLTPFAKTYAGRSICALLPHW